MSANFATRAAFLKFEAQYLTGGPNLSEAVGFVEATHNEHHHCWEEYRKYRSEDKWQQYGGPLIQVGRYHGNPVNITVSFVKIDGYLVAFYHDCCRVVDHTMIENFIHMIRCEDAFCTDAGNFFNVVHHIERLKKELESTKVVVNGYAA